MKKKDPQKLIFYGVQSGLGKSAKKAKVMDPVERGVLQMMEASSNAPRNNPIDLP